MNKHANEAIFHTIVVTGFKDITLVWPNPIYYPSLRTNVLKLHIKFLKLERMHKIFPCGSDGYTTPNNTKFFHSSQLFCKGVPVKTSSGNSGMDNKLILISQY